MSGLKNNMSNLSAKILICMLMTCATTIILLIYYNPIELASVITSVKNNRDFDFQDRKIPSSPRCTNLLSNLTSGYWSIMPDKENEVKYYDKFLSDYRDKKGIVNGYRKDLKCGFFQTQNPPANSSWRPVGSWCDPLSERPCCSNKWDGVCLEPKQSTCDCILCEDSRKYKHAEVAEWKTIDQRCTWINYTRVQSCSIIEKSGFDDIYYVGDSFARNMFTNLLMLLSDSSIAFLPNKTTAERDICNWDSVYFWKACRQLLTSIDDIKPKKLCGGYKHKFNVTLKPFYSLQFAGDFLHLVQSLIGRRGSLVLLSVGYHMKCSSKAVTEQYLNPAVEAIETYYSSISSTTAERWPQIYFLSPMPVSLFKPPEYFHLQNEASLTKYGIEMKEYCNKQNITILDFGDITKNVHSFDGSHFGRGVNLMKNQLLLNYIASLES